MCTMEEEMAAKKKAEDDEHLKENRKKWGSLLEPGWTIIPNIILEKQHALGLDPVDVNLIAHLARHWWHADRAPYPSHSSLATCLNVDRSTVLRRLKALRAAGLIDWTVRKRPDGGQSSNAYDLSGLIEAAKPFAAEALEHRAEDQARRKARRAKKKPATRLELVKKDG